MAGGGVAGKPVSEVSDVEALRVAQEECGRRGIPWREPYRVKKGWRWWTVQMPSNQRGGNAIVLVSRKTGKVKMRYYRR